jgi:WbqC-like protein family
LTTVAILQSNYVPWRGYFDLIRRSDHFVLYDTVQYTKNDWRNRNRIVTPQGPVWITVPVLHNNRFGQSIAETRISDPRWTRRHLGTLQAALGRAPRYRDALAPALSDWYAEAAGLDRLSAVNRLLIDRVMAMLGLTTRLHDAADLPQTGDRTGRLVSMCQALGATRYLTGPAARAYLDEAQFAAAGIAVDWMAYPDYPAYRQADGGYTPGVSILDVMANLPADKVFG